MADQRCEGNKTLPQAHPRVLIHQQQRELETLLLTYGEITDRRKGLRWRYDWHQEGWLQVHDTPESTIPVILVDFSAGGVGVVLHGSHNVHPGQSGQLMTQAHGGGCSVRPVRCRSIRTHPLEERLRYLGLSFE
jgi:hypothetical protein